LRSYRKSPALALTAIASSRIATSRNPGTDAICCAADGAVRSMAMVRNGISDCAAISAAASSLAWDARQKTTAIARRGEQKKSTPNARNHLDRNRRGTLSFRNMQLSTEYRKHRGLQLVTPDWRILESRGVPGCPRPKMVAHRLPFSSREGARCKPGLGARNAITRRVRAATFVSGRTRTYSSKWITRTTPSTPG
jgi:hypothetical protein